VRIENSRQGSSIVTGVSTCNPNVDYNIDYLQGRLVLSQPLSSDASDNLLSPTSGLSGDEANLVVRYEYTPGSKSWTKSPSAVSPLLAQRHVLLGLTADPNEGTPPATSAPQT